jgi:plastocyanin
MKKLLVLLVALALAPLPLAACGGDDDDDGGEEAATTEQTTETDGGGGGGEATTVQLSADPDGAIAYTTDTLEASAGEVTIDFENAASLGHDVCIEAPDGGEDVCSETISEGSSSVSATLSPGDYAFYCSVAGHRDQGMEGTLTVQ